MRDDLVTLFEHELELLSRKKDLFEKFLISENDKLFSLNEGKTEKCLRMFSDDDLFIAEIDSIDYHVRKTEDQAAGIIGVPHSKFDEFISGRDEDIIQAVCSMKKEISTMVSELVVLRDRTIALLESELEKTGEEIESFKSLARIKASGILRKKL